MSTKRSLDLFSNLLFGEISQEKVESFLQGDLATEYSARQSLERLKHPELKSAYRELSNGFSGNPPTVVYQGNQGLYLSNGHASSYSEAILFQPDMKELVLGPFTGLVEAANPQFKYEQGPGELRLAFRNLHHKNFERTRSQPIRRIKNQGGRSARNLR